MSKPQKTFTKTQFLAIMWALFGVALLFLASRLVIRLKVYGRLMVDDGLVILAIICLLANDTVYTTMFSKTYIIQNVDGYHVSKPFHYQEIVNSYVKYQWAGAYLFFTGLWAVKGSFLAYYDDLTKRLTIFRRAWWVTIGFTILTYVGCLFAYAFLDGNNFKTKLKNEAIKYQFAADLSTDVFITMIPLLMILKSQIPVGQKFALAGIFSLSLINTVISIIRFALNTPSRGIVGPIWIQAWSILEQSVSVTVACLASFRLFAVHKRRKSERSSSRGRVKNTSGSGSGSQKLRLAFTKAGFSELRPHWGRPSVQPRDTGSMEFQLLDATPLRKPAEVAAPLKHENEL